MLEIQVPLSLDTLGLFTVVKSLPVLLTDTVSEAVMLTQLTMALVC